MCHEPPINKVMVAMVGLKLVAVLILLGALLQFVYVGNHLISEKYDTEIVDMVRAAFYLGVMIGVVAMLVVESARSVVGVAADLFVDGLKYVRDHITGEKQKQATQPDWAENTFGLNSRDREHDSRLR